MLNGGLVDVLALVPTRMQIYMGDLAAAASGHLQQFTSIEEMVPDSADRTYAVALIPATGFSGGEWWTIWGILNDKDPRPCIVVYALRSDFELWSSVLDAGAFDLIVAPFTAEKSVERSCQAMRNSLGGVQNKTRQATTVRVTRQSRRAS